MLCRLSETKKLLNNGEKKMGKKSREQYPSLVRTFKTWNYFLYALFFSLVRFADKISARTNMTRGGKIVVAVFITATTYYRFILLRSSIFGIIMQQYITQCDAIHFFCYNRIRIGLFSLCSARPMDKTG